MDPGPAPANILDQNLEFLPQPAPDAVAQGKNFGDVANDTAQNYTAGTTASVTFYGANPRHNQKVTALCEELVILAIVPSAHPILNLKELLLLFDFWDMLMSVRTNFCLHLGRVYVVHIISHK